MGPDALWSPAPYIKRENPRLSGMQAGRTHTCLTHPTSQILSGTWSQLKAGSHPVSLHTRMWSQEEVGKMDLEHTNIICAMWEGEQGPVEDLPCMYGCIILNTKWTSQQDGSSLKNLSSLFELM